MACCTTLCGQAPPRLRPAAEPALIGFATYLGGSREDIARAVAVDDAGYLYVTGHTDSTDFPLAPAGAGNPLGGSRDAFVAKFTPDGKTLVWSVYLGGSLPDSGNAIAVDAAGNVYVAGETQSADFPTTSGAFQTAPGGGPFMRDAFIAKLSPSGDTLLYSTYLGGDYDDAATGIAVDGAGNAHVTGWTWAADFPTHNAIRSRWSGDDCVLAVSPSSGFPLSIHPCEDAFVAKLNPAGSALVFSTYLGGQNRDLGEAIALDPWGNVWVTGSTRSEDFPVLRSIGAKHGGGTCNLPTSVPSAWSRYTCEDAFVMKLSAEGPAVMFSTFLGGDSADMGRAIAVDANGDVLVAGETASAAFPATPGVVQAAPGGGVDAFLVKLRGGGLWAFSTFLGGAGDDRAFGLAVDPEGNAYVAGATTSVNFPLYPSLPETASGQGFVSKLHASGTALLFSGRLRAELDAVAVDSLGTACVAGTARSDFPTTPGAFQTANRGAADAAVARLDLLNVPRISPNGVLNAASYLFGPVAPGEIVTIFGTGIGPRRAATLRLNAAGMVDTLLGSTAVLFDGILAPVIYAHATQTSAVVPYGVAGRASVQIEIEHRGSRTSPVSLPVDVAAPGVFALDAAGRGQGAILNEDYTVNSPANPAPRGSIVMVFATGEGRTEPAGVDGKPAQPPLPKPRLPVTAKIGGLDANVIYAGGAPGLVAGVMQVNVLIPEGVFPGSSVPLVLAVAGVTSQPGITLAVR